MNFVKLKERKSSEEHSKIKFQPMSPTPIPLFEISATRGSEKTRCSLIRRHGGRAISDTLDINDHAARFIKEHSRYKVELSQE